MYLYALGIYEYHPVTGEIKLNTFVQKDSIKPNTNTQLHDLENKLIPPDALSLAPNRLYYNDDIIECQYVQRLTESSVILAIVKRGSYKKDDLIIILKILNNMTHIYLKQSKYDVTLNDLLMNPHLNDIVIDKTNKTIDEVKDVNVKNIDKVIKRNEDIDEILEKVKILHDDTVKLDEGAKKLNKCCRW
ncbi:MAG TPA: hypothetical protein VHM20_04405 [Gammaproteobacteria bacterium]|jgi:hypothetical protein|nr:hypothetical protein [Gammaproteobacteria bacterium]